MGLNARRLLQPSNYDDFVSIVDLLGSQNYIFYVPGYWVININPELDIIIYTVGGTFTQEVVTAHFPNAIQFPIGSRIPSVNSDSLAIFYDYTQFKTVVSTINLGGRVVTITASAFTCALYGSDGTWNIQYSTKSQPTLGQPSSFIMDFPNAIALTGGSLP